MGYRPVVFYSTNERNEAIYHTNVMMCVADRFVVICLDSIRDPAYKEFVSESILSSGKEIVPISLDQMNHFAGNMLQLENKRGEKVLVMSTAAWNSLMPAQKEKLSSYNLIAYAALENIETNGGGSARCMIAEIHL
jgi:hypothetical protein